MRTGSALRVIAEPRDGVDLAAAERAAGKPVTPEALADAGLPLELLATP